MSPYIGRRLDAETMLMYFRHRMYNSLYGGFTSFDPLGYVDGMALSGAYFIPSGRDPQGEVAWVPIACAVIIVGEGIHAAHMGYEIYKLSHDIPLRVKSACDACWSRALKTEDPPHCNSVGNWVSSKDPGGFVCRTVIGESGQPVMWTVPQGGDEVGTWTQCPNGVTSGAN